MLVRPIDSLADPAKAPRIVSAFAEHAGQTVRCDERSRSAEATRLLPQQREQPVPSCRPRPAPHLPRRCSAAHREEDDLGRSDEFFERHITHVGEWGGLRILAVITYHE